MEAALKELQQQLEQNGNESQLEKIGEALSLSEEMAAAGQAMAKGDMDKAAEELTKLEMPKLDLKTEKAITEKLKQIGDNSNGNSPSKKTQLKESTEQISEGLSNGNKRKFQDGMQGLASECKSQGNKKKLVDLLRKQCQCLSECKSQCESECRNQADAVKPGGKKAGTAKSGNSPGDKTVKLKTNPKMDIKGQDSGQGDTDVETEDAGMQTQQASANIAKKWTSTKRLASRC